MIYLKLFPNGKRRRKKASTSKIISLWISSLCHSTCGTVPRMMIAHYHQWNIFGWTPKSLFSPCSFLFLCYLTSQNKMLLWTPNFHQILMVTSGENKSKTKDPNLIVPTQISKQSQPTMLLLETPNFNGELRSKTCSHAGLKIAAAKDEDMRPWLHVSVLCCCTSTSSHQTFI